MLMHIKRGFPLYLVSNPGPNYPSGLTWTLVTRRTPERARGTGTGLCTSSVVRVFACACTDTLVSRTVVSSLCIDRFVGAAVKATGVQQQRKNKESWLIDEV